MTQEPFDEQSVGIHWIFDTTEFATFDGGPKDIIQVVGNFFVANPVSIMVMHVVVITFCILNVSWVDTCHFFDRCLVHPCVVQDSIFVFVYNKLVYSIVFTASCKLYEQRLFVRSFCLLWTERHLARYTFIWKRNRFYFDVVIASNSKITVKLFISSVVYFNGNVATRIKICMFAGNVITIVISSYLGSDNERVVVAVRTREVKFILVFKERRGILLAFHQFRLDQHIRTESPRRRGHSTLIPAAVHEWKA